MMSTAKQRQLIGYYRRLLNLDDIAYYGVLSACFNVASSKDLTQNQADDLIDCFRQKTRQLGLSKTNKTNANNLSNRCGMASIAQLKKIQIMWDNVSFLESPKARANALNKLIKNIVGYDHINFLKSEHVPKIINAIKAMKNRKRRQ